MGRGCIRDEKRHVADIFYELVANHTLLLPL